ncbi:hypothetical protein CPC08DRAFT_813969 [Agrocybe pediades]|nr:hypothetical protein CPC08DRAFT_813969 [Agrocybe pediades]
MAYATGYNAATTAATVFTSLPHCLAPISVGIHKTQPSRNSQKMSDILLYVRVDSVEQALAAVRSGAHGLQICHEAATDGGTTPKMETVGSILNAIATESGRTIVVENLDITICIRPRPGNFVYEDKYFDRMLQAIRAFNNCLFADAINGFHLAIQAEVKDPWGATLLLDSERIQKLAKACRPKQIHLNGASLEEIDGENVQIGLDELSKTLRMNGASRLNSHVVPLCVCLADVDEEFLCRSRPIKIVQSAADLSRTYYSDNIVFQQTVSMDFNAHQADRDVITHNFWQLFRNATSDLPIHRSILLVPHENNTDASCGSLLKITRSNDPIKKNIETVYKGAKDVWKCLAGNRRSVTGVTQAEVAMEQRIRNSLDMYY